MNQPEWVKVVNLGDVCPIEYGGYFVYRDATGAHVEQAEYLDAPDDPEGGTWTVYRFDLDRCTWINGVLSDNKFHPELSAWFATSESERANRPQDTTYLSNVIQCCDHESLRSDLCSADPVLRAMAYKSIASYHGWENFDSYPLTLNETEVRARYPEYP